jgi:protein-S-isoprenylcysteine O-methyltransferase Ste14
MSGGKTKRPDKDMQELVKEFYVLKGTLENGLNARVKWIEQMQWWQIGIMLVFFGIILSGVFFMFQAGRAETRLVLDALKNHVLSTHGGTP